jgi:hypothetical protein
VRLLPRKRWGVIMRSYRPPHKDYDLDIRHWTQWGAERHRDFLQGISQGMGYIHKYHITYDGKIADAVIYS